jgi:surface antigen
LTKQEQQQADHAQTQALQSGKVGDASKVSWASNESSTVNGGTEIESRDTDASGHTCAVTHTFITDVDGKEKSVDRKMCQGADGAWSAA